MIFGVWRTVVSNKFNDLETVQNYKNMMESAEMGQANMTAMITRTRMPTNLAANHAAQQPYIVFTMTNIGGNTISTIPAIKHARAIFRCLRMTRSTIPIIVSRNPPANSISDIPITLSSHETLMIWIYCLLIILQRFFHSDTTPAKWNWTAGLGLHLRF